MQTIASLHQALTTAAATLPSALVPLETINLQLEFDENASEDDNKVKVKLTVCHAVGSSWALPTTFYGAATMAATSGWAAASALSAYVPYSTKKAPSPPSGREQASPLDPPQSEAVEENDNEEDREDKELLLDMAEVLGTSVYQDPTRDFQDRENSSMRLRFDRVPTSTSTESIQEQLRRQGGKCQGCGCTQGGAPFRICHYTGGAFCDECLKSGQLSVIPARVVFDWDFIPRQVCSSAYEYLTSIQNQPMINITALNVGLLHKIPLLADLTKKRRAIIENIARVNRDLSGGEEMTAVAALRREAGESRAYLLQIEDTWSLTHLMEIHASASTIQQLSAYVSASESLPKWLARVYADTLAMCRSLGSV